jgi:hypothetical protein
MALGRAPAMPPNSSVSSSPGNRLLTAAEFHRLADVPPEVEWFANLNNPSTRRIYENAIRDLTISAGSCSLMTAAGRFCPAERPPARRDRTGRAADDVALPVAGEGGGFVPGPVVGHRALDGEKAPVVVSS